MLARLSQRNVLRVYGAAVHDGRPGIWNEWIEGRTLDAIVEAEDPFASTEAAHIGLELCAGLGAIHAAGLLHGDVKASNAMRARGGRIVLTDLGAAGAPDALNASLHMQATPAYLSPQSHDGAPRSKSDDLYALGVLLHFLVSGTYPRDGAAACAKPRRISSLVSPRSSIAHWISQPEKRFSDAQELADALRASLGLVDAPAKAQSQRGLIAIVVAVLAVADRFCLVEPSHTGMAGAGRPRAPHRHGQRTVARRNAVARRRSRGPDADRESPDVGLCLQRGRGRAISMCCFR